MTAMVIRGGTVVTPDGTQAADVAIDEGTVTAIGPDLPAGLVEVNARDLVVLPGVIDVHVHFNEPGRASWEGAATGSRALAAGGGTCFLDMPLNSTPCVVDVEAFDAKRAALEAVAITDFGIWGGLVPGRLEAMPDLAARGVCGFKAFMCDSGLAEFPRADDATLLAGMRTAAALGAIIAVHAESDELTRRPSAVDGADDVAAFLASRPVVAEVEAVQRALLFAEETGARLHLVHLSSGRAVLLAAEARRRGVDVSIETCPHYLAFTEADVERLGAVAKCAPPLRPAGVHAALWQTLLDGHVDIVGSDHSPAEPALKTGRFADAWGGIAGVQSTLAVLLDRGHHGRGLSLERIAALTAHAPSARFGLARKGAIAVGYDADLTLVSPAEAYTLAAEHLHQRHPISPYVGQAFRGRVIQTLRRGEVLVDRGRVVASGGGRFVAPSR
jgi:allantoinase